MSDSRKRCFATILYTDSCAPDFMQKLESMHIPAFLSPLHDRDLKEDGSIKKPHYHLMLMFQGKNLKTRLNLFLINWVE